MSSGPPVIPFSTLWGMGGLVESPWNESARFVRLEGRGEIEHARTPRARVARAHARAESLRGGAGAGVARNRFAVAWSRSFDETSAVLVGQDGVCVATCPGDVRVRREVRGVLLLVVCDGGPVRLLGDVEGQQPRDLSSVRRRRRLVVLGGRRAVRAGGRRAVCRWRRAVRAGGRLLLVRVPLDYGGDHRRVVPAVRLRSCICRAVLFCVPDGARSDARAHGQARRDPGSDSSRHGAELGPGPGSSRRAAAATTCTRSPARV